MKKEEKKQTKNVEEKKKCDPKKEAPKKVEKKAEEKPERKQVYMVTFDKEAREWVIKKTGADRASRRCKTKQEALEIVDKLSENQDLGVSVKKKDGKFQKKSNL